ncbi:MAG: hypothetical protein HDQ96_11915 [Lachnospiraceae bacterium]|nr:hypothetical protein [Lachnospiraceae bacterium]
MNIKKKIRDKKFLLKIVEATVVAGVIILFSCLFDYRYAMNDDVFVNAIISGKYSGKPDFHNVSVGTPLNALFCLLYRVSGNVPWFGMVMILCQFYSLYSIIMLLGKKMEMGKICTWIYILVLNILLAGIMVSELVIVQYTYTAALLMASATLGLYCLDGDFPDKKKVVSFGGILLQYLFAYCLRTEIFLFLLPFSLLLTLIHYYRVSGFRINKNELKKWGVVWGSLICGSILLYVLNAGSYVTEEWKEYKLVDDYRTRLYDFLELPSYEENQEFYQSAEISKVQYELLKNYNFSLDDGITSKTLQNVVDYVNDKRVSEYQGIKKLYYGMFRLPLNEGIWSYCHRVLFDSKLAKEDYPWNIVCMGLYLVFLLLTCLSKRLQNFVYIILMFSMRSVLWMYIILKQRTPPRVTHSLFLIEMVCLLVLIFEEMSWLQKNKISGKYKTISVALSALFLFGACAVAVSSWQSFRGVYAETVTFNEKWEDMLAYCREREDNFYFMDVYSTVNYSETIFTGRYSELDNYDICGGWLAKSPLCAEKYGQFGIASIQTALIENDNVYFVAEEGSDLAWLYALYEEKGITLEPRCQDRVAEHFCVYQLQCK